MNEEIVSLEYLRRVNGTWEMKTRAENEEQGEILDEVIWKDSGRVANG